MRVGVRSLTLQGIMKNQDCLKRAGRRTGFAGSWDPLGSYDVLDAEEASKKAIREHDRRRGLQVRLGTLVKEKTIQPLFLIHVRLEQVHPMVTPEYP